MGLLFSDATMVHSQEEKGKDIVVKLGVMYSGKELESQTAQHRRYRLKEKVVYGSIEEPEEFGEKVYLRAEEKLSLSRAKNVLMKCAYDRGWGLLGPGYSRLKGKVEARRVLVCGSEAMEKNIDIVIGRRFKKRGMSWSTEGGAESPQTKGAVV